MSERTFDRETVLDLTVNIIPLGIILFFVVVFLLIRPWEQNLFVQAISMGLLAVPFVALAFLTFVSGRAISRAEKSETEATTLDSSFDESEGTLSGTEDDTDDTDDVTAAVEPIGTDDSDGDTGTNATESTENGGSADDESADEH